MTPAGMRSDSRAAWIAENARVCVRVRVFTLIARLNCATSISNKRTKTARPSGNEAHARRRWRNAATKLAFVCIASEVACVLGAVALQVPVRLVAQCQQARYGITQISLA